MVNARSITVFCVTIISLVCQSLEAPPIANDASNIAVTNDTHIITIERLESLLRRASEIFRPVMAAVSEELQQPDLPNRDLQPPNAHPYNFYLPPFELDENSEKLDEKSRNMEKIMPPPPNHSGAETNYYTVKPKKIPKKFNAAEKLVNIKWLNAFEREALADHGQIPKAVYLINEERNRINFDDSFFAVDLLVRPPSDNKIVHKETKPASGSEREQDFLSQTEEGEDLIAVPAAHLAQITKFNTKKHPNEAIQLQLFHGNQIDV